MGERADVVMVFEEPREERDERGLARLAAELSISAGGGRVSRSAFRCPLGAGENDAIRWYLEVFHAWPFGDFRERARGIEGDLLRWGEVLHRATLGREEHEETVVAWRESGHDAGARLLIQVNGEGAAAARLLGLPWELMAEGGVPLVDPPVRARVQRQLARERALEPLAAGAPLRVLLIVARPEAEGLAFIDPRATALPMLESLRPLGDRVEVTLLGDASLDGLRDAVERADGAGRPFHVVHFDGHGLVDEHKGVGLLCFEFGAGDGLGRQLALVEAGVIGEMLADRRVPLVILEACQSASARGAVSASLAGTLVGSGVGSVVAMSHTVRAASTRRFVGAFYRGMAEGRRIGEAVGVARSAMRLHALQHALGSDEPAAHALQDWFVPVLYQEAGGDVALAPQGAQRGGEGVLQSAGALPSAPAHGFVGRARDLLWLQRRLVRGRSVALVGEGGLGKTALAVELARWLLETRSVHRVAFVSVERFGEVRVVLDHLGGQLIDGYTVARAEGSGTAEVRLDRALAPVLEALAGARALLVVDNLEAVLDARGRSVAEGAEELIALLGRMGEVGDTRMIVTSRAAPPAPLDRHLHRLGPLSVDEGARLVAQVLERAGQEPAGASGEDEGWAQRLVEAVDGHARSLVLLAGPVAAEGLEPTVHALARHMQRLEMQFPGQRERSLLASTELSLARLPVQVRQQLASMAAVRHNVHAAVLAAVLQVDVDEALDLCRQLIDVGLAEADGPYLLPDPALAPALAVGCPDAVLRPAQQRWLDATVKLVDALYDQHHGDSHLAARGVDLTLGGTLGVLEELEARVEAGLADAARATRYATSLEALVTGLGRPRVVDRVVAARQRLAAQLSGWSHDRFAAEGHEITRLIRVGEAVEAVAGAEQLLRRAQVEGACYEEAGYDQAMGSWLLGRALLHAGRAADALRPLGDAEIRFFALAADALEGAERMASVVLAEQGDALRHLGRLDEAVVTLRRAIAMDEARGDQRQLAHVRVSLGIVRARQGRPADALETFQRARELFAEMDDPVATANCWHQMGTVYVQGGAADRAERAFQQALRLRARAEDRSGEAVTLVQLGNLYRETARTEEALTFFTQAADILHDLGDAFREAAARNNLAEAYHALGRLDEAREALGVALERGESAGVAAHPWKTLAVLADVERDAGDAAAAAEAEVRAFESYLGYRREGGEPLDGATRLVADIGGVLRSRGGDAAQAALPPPEVFGDGALVLRDALVALARGERDLDALGVTGFPYALRAEFALLAQLS